MFFVGPCRKGETRRRLVTVVVWMISVLWQVTMPAGAVPGHTVTIGGRGYEHPDKTPGNVRVVAVQLGHPRFDREGASPANIVRLSRLYFRRSVIFSSRLGRRGFGVFTYDRRVLPHGHGNQGIYPPPPPPK